MRAFLPDHFLQVDLHQRGGDPARLDLLKDLLLQADIQPIFRIDFSGKKETGLLILPARSIIHPFEEWEPGFVTQFIVQGNSLFHLSSMYPWTVNDSILGQRFGYRFHSRVIGQDPLDIFSPLDSHV